MSQVNEKRALAVLVLLSTIALLVGPLWGPTSVSFAAVWSGDTVASQIIWQLRVPRVGCAYVVGALLAVAGLVVQTLFRNPLATPFTLGISSGAALCAGLYTWLGIFFSAFGLSGVAVAAFLGAIGTLWLVVVLDKLHGTGSTGILIIGMMLSFFFSAILMFVQYLSDASQIFRITRWLMGGLEASSWSALGLLAVVGGLMMYDIARHHHELDVLQLGDELAATRGVETERVRRRLLVASAILVAVVVACAGPIGFVGIMVPFAVRPWVGTSHAAQLAGCILSGGLFLLVSDTLARTIISPYEIPAGVITALTGVPFFFLVLTRFNSRIALRC